MRTLQRSVFLAWLGSCAAVAQISHFEHIVVIFQENRTPDNLFQGLCRAPVGSADSCSPTPQTGQYNIQTRNWLDRHSTTGVTQPGIVALANKYDLSHAHTAFLAQCDRDTLTGACQMDGAGDVKCSGTCPAKPQFRYVDNAGGILNPYLELAKGYGWANYMFQTNQGPSFPAHQFIFGGTSAPTAEDDAKGVFASENMSGTGKVAGCTAEAGTTVEVIAPGGENQKIYPCFEHATMADLLSSDKTWRYYAPNAIQHICQSTGPGGTCAGSGWAANVDLKPADVLSDIAACKLRNLSWVIPAGYNSDHARGNDGGGPSWVASIVNAIGNNPACKDGETYWDNTAIVITWDDWGGWYDHESPTFLAEPQGDYQYGFRVPMIVVSAYTPAAYVNNDRLDFGSILRFVEKNFGIEEGALNFADARSAKDMSPFFNLTQPPRAFTTIPARFDAEHFLRDTSAPLDTDDD